MAWFRKPKPQPPASATAAATVQELRRRVLAALGESALPASPISGIVVDWALEKATATVVCLADGTTSLYYSNGGGVIGAGTHESVRRASEALLATAARSLDAIAGPDDGSYPEPGCFRFHVHGLAGPRAATATVQELASGSHPLSPLFAATQGVITAIREIGRGR